MGQDRAVRSGQRILNSALRIEYVPTLDESVAVHLRSYERAHGRIGRNWGSMLLSAIVVGGAVYIISPGELWVSIGFALGAAALAAALGPHFIRGTVEKKIRTQLEPTAGEPFVVELRDEGLWTRSDGMQILFEWPHVEQIDEHSLFVEFAMRGGGLIMVQKRAFRTPDELEDFLTEARRRQAAFTEVEL